jgi:hypothetical protein
MGSPKFELKESFPLDEKSNLMRYTVFTRNKLVFRKQLKALLQLKTFYSVDKCLSYECATGKVGRDDKKRIYGKGKYCRFVILVTELLIDFAVYYSNRLIYVCIYLFIVVLVTYIKKTVSHQFSDPLHPPCTSENRTCDFNSTTHTF